MSSTCQSVIASGFALLALGACNQQAPPVPDGYLSVEAVREDLRALYDGLESGHFDLFADKSRADYDDAFDGAYASVTDPMTPEEAQILFQTFAAFGDVAHARVDFPVSIWMEYVGEGGVAFPLYPRFSEGRFFIGEDYSGSDLVSEGDEVVAINGVSIEGWLERLGRHLSADTDYLLETQLEFSWPVYLWLETEPVDAFELEVRRHGEGAIETVMLPALTRADMQANQASAAADEESPLREARMLSDRVAYLKPGPFYNAEDPANLWDTASYLTFLDEGFENVIAAGADALIVDVRNNPGGDAAFSDPIAAWFADEPFRFALEFYVRSSPEAEAANAARLDPDDSDSVNAIYAEKFAETPYGEVFEVEFPEVQPREEQQFEGNVYVLVDRHSYSNAVTFAAMVQDYGFGTIIGEETADLATTYGAMESFTLPNSGVSVGFPKAHIIRPNGDESVRGVVPDIAIPAPIVLGEGDVVLDAALALVEGR